MSKEICVNQVIFADLISTVAGKVKLKYGTPVSNFYKISKGVAGFCP